MPKTTFTLDTHDDTPVVVHRWEPDGRVRGVVNLAHGLAEHAARYGHVAQRLNDVGFSVYAQDHRGHGETARTEDELGHFADSRGWARVLDDLHRVSLRARADHQQSPLFVMGHSMGALLVQQYLFTFPAVPDGAVLSGPPGPAGPILEVASVLARLERARLGRRGRSELLRSLHFGGYNKPFEPARTPFDWLSRDPDQVDRYIEDARCGWTGTAQLYVDLFAGARVVEQSRRLRDIRADLPITMFAGAEDPVGGPSGIEGWLERYGGAGLTHVEHRFYPAGRHEMLNETNRDEVISELLAWLESRVAGRGAADRGRPPAAM